MMRLFPRLRCRDNPGRVSVWAVLGSLVLCLGGCSPGAPSHGVGYVVAMDTNRPAGAPDPQDTLQVVREALRMRLDRLGMGFSIEPAGDGRLLIKLPVLKPDEAVRLRQTLTRGGVLEFRLVHGESESLTRDGVAPPDYELLGLPSQRPGGAERTEQVVVRKQSEMKWTRIMRASVMRAPSGEPEIFFTLDPEGAAKFAALTRANVGRRLAIVVDGELYSAPVIRSPIEGGAGQITGHFDPDEAAGLAGVMENPLPTPLRIVGESPY